MTGYSTVCQCVNKTIHTALCAFLLHWYQTTEVQYCRETQVQPWSIAGCLHKSGRGALTVVGAARYGKRSKEFTGLCGPQKFLLLATSYHTAACQYHKHIYIIFWCTTIVYWSLALVWLTFVQLFLCNVLIFLVTPIWVLFRQSIDYNKRKMLVWTKLYYFTADGSTCPSESW